MAASIQFICARYLAIRFQTNGVKVFDHLHRDHLVQNLPVEVEAWKVAGDLKKASSHRPCPNIVERSQSPRTSTCTPKNHMALLAN